jgi:hypothetical protein
VAAMLFVPTGAASPAASSCATIHVVKWGQTAAIIARSYGVSVSQLSTTNALANPDRIYVGQKLCVPASGSASTAQTSTSPSSKPSGNGICVSGQVIDTAHRGLAGMQVVAETDQQPGTKIETDDEGYFTFENLPPSLWTFRVIVPDSWETITPSEFKVEVSYGHTGCYQVRFKNRPSDLCAEGYKVDENGTGLLDWTVVAYPASDPAARMQATTDSEGYYRFNGQV